MKTVSFTVECKALYTSQLQVPDEIAEDRQQLLAYIRDHLPQCSVHEIEFLEDLDTEDAVWEDSIEFSNSTEEYENRHSGMLSE